jgi:two-component system, NtrC family, sensor kinase
MNLAKGARVSSIDSSLGGLCFASGIENLAQIGLDNLSDARGARSRPSALRHEATAKGNGEDAVTDAPLRALRRLEVLGALTDGLAHDFNNLLTIILGNLERLMDRSEDPELQHQVNTAHDAAKRGERLIRSLQSFARSKPADGEPLDLNGVIRDMEALLVHCLAPRIRLVTRLDADPCLVEADASQIEMAILNLAVNARDAMPEGGTLCIETAIRILSGEYDGLGGGFIALTVADTGCGMSPEVLARAFEPHFTTKPKGKGTGLGLPTVRDLAKRGNGTVTIESAPGKGTTVTVYLPQSQSGADAGTAAKR